VVNWRLVALITCVALTGALGGGSGVALAVPKKAKVTNWRGQVQAVGDHYIYVGRGCPEKAEMCATVQVRYRIKGDSGKVRRSLAGAVGHDTRLKGRLAKSTDPRYDGVLEVKKVTVLDGASGVEGTATLEGACPGGDCDAMPAALDLRLLRPDGSVAATGRSTNDGRFRIPAPPGSYFLSAEGDGEVVDCSSVQVRITAGQFTRADISCEVNFPDIDVDQDPGMDMDQDPPDFYDPGSMSTGNEIDFPQS
jgi:hypothetical protein